MKTYIYVNAPVVSPSVFSATTLTSEAMMATTATRTARTKMGFVAICSFMWINGLCICVLDDKQLMSSSPFIVKLCSRQTLDVLIVLYYRIDALLFF